MSTPQAETSRFRVKMNADTRVSSYDQTSAFLVAGVVVIGVLVFILFMIWLTLFAGAPSPPKTAPIVDLAGNDDRPEGVADDWQPPGVEEFPEVEQPQLADALEAVTDSVSSVRAQLEKVDGNAMEMGSGSGLGDKRKRGLGGGDGNIIPEWDRWKIEYSASTMGEYMNILESFDISIGAVSQLSNQIAFLDDLNNARATVTYGNRESPEAKRLYFRNTKNRLRRWDRNKVVASGVEDKNRLVVQFYSAALRQQLLELENAVYNKDGKTLEEVKKTQFRIRPAGSGFEFYIPSGGVEYRPKPR